MQHSVWKKFMNVIEVIRRHCCVELEREQMYSPQQWKMSRLYLKNDAFVTDGNDSELLLLLYLVQVRFWAYAECKRCHFCCQSEPAGLGARSVNVLCLCLVDTSPLWWATGLLFSELTVPAGDGALSAEVVCVAEGLRSLFQPPGSNMVQRKFCSHSRIN